MKLFRVYDPRELDLATLRRVAEKEGGLAVGALASSERREGLVPTRAKPEAEGVGGPKGPFNASY